MAAPEGEISHVQNESESFSVNFTWFLEKSSGSGQRVNNETQSNLSWKGFSSGYWRDKNITVIESLRSQDSLKLKQRSHKGLLGLPISFCFLKIFVKHLVKISMSAITIYVSFLIFNIFQLKYNYITSSSFLSLPFSHTPPPATQIDGLSCLEGALR